MERGIATVGPRNSDFVNQLMKYSKVTLDGLAYEPAPNVVISSEFLGSGLNCMMLGLEW